MNETSLPARRYVRRTRATSRRAVAGVLAMATAAAGVGVGCTGTDDDGDEEPAGINVQGESPARTNMPTASDPDAANGRYLALDTAEEPPPEGWYATYEVDVPAAGVYRLDAVATAPMDQRHTENVGSYVNLSVNDGPFGELARSQPQWAASPPAWGDLSLLSLGDLDLERGVNTLTFMVDQPSLATGSPTYRWLLDQLTLTPTDVALARVYLGDPATNLGIYRAAHPTARADDGDDADELHLALNGRASDDKQVSYRVADYFATEVEAGTATISAGETTASVGLPDLPPGNYRVTAWLESSPDDTVVGHFAHLPGQEPVAGPANRFGVNTSAFAVVPPSRLDAFMVAMREMGAGYVRDGDPAPPQDPENTEPGGPYDRLTEAYHENGLQTLEFMTPTPSWEITEMSVPLPADLRDAYTTARFLASKPDGLRSDAVQLWNEPDNDDTSSTGDQHAAYVKAAALGLADGAHPPLTVLSGIAGEDNGFQELMLQNDVARYADVWSFHTYALDQEDPELPGSDEQHELHQQYGGETEVWATEAGMFLEAEPDVGDLTVEQQTTQARYLVQSTVEDLAAGTDRRFWFVGAPVYEDGIQWSLLNQDFQPWPAYSAHAALASLLGEANFVDLAIDEATYTVRFLFDAGGHAVTVVWAAEPVDVEVAVPGDTVAVYDIMGHRTDTVEPGDRGSVQVSASADPVYLVSDAPAEGEATPPAGETDHRHKDEPFSPAERIVLSQHYEAANAAPSKDDGDAEPPLGYQLGAITEMAVDVYNFDDSERTVTLAAEVDEGWSVEPTGQDTVQVPPMGRVTVPFMVTVGDGVSPGVDHPLVFTATVGDQPATPSVSRIQLATGTSEVRR